MAKISPFNGVFFNKEKCGNLSKVMIPPYDVISSKARDDFYNMHSYNAIRLTLGKEFAGDNDLNNKYSRSAAFLNSWIKNNVLIMDEEPSIYAYEQRFKYKSKKYSRLGFIALYKLEELEAGHIYPHEDTLSKPKEDRLNLMKATSANLEPIFTLYVDKDEKISKVIKKNIKRKPVIEVKDSSGIINKLWRISSKPAMNKIIKEMLNKQVFIADGHHRYEASLKYRNEMRAKAQKSSGDEPYNYIMIYFTNIFDKGLVIMPIHRLVLDLNLKEKINLENRIYDFFETEEIKFSRKTEGKARRKLIKLMSKTGEGQHSFGMYLQGENKYILLKLKNEKIIEKYINTDKPKEWKKLDITILHALIIKEILGITEKDIQSENIIKYVHNDDEAFELVKEGKYQLAFFLNPTKIEEIIAVASKYEKMPQKSTFFYPKLLTGLVMYKMQSPDKFSF